MKGERWRDVEGFKGYQISDHGNVRSCRNRGPHYGYSDTWHALKPIVCRGYASVTLIGENQTRSTHRTFRPKVHNLVLTTFVGPRPEGMHGSHLDGNRLNNVLANLAWETPDDNEFRKYAHGTRASAEKHPRAKLTNEKVALIRQLHAAGKRNVMQLARDFGVGETTMRHIIACRTWVHVA